MKEKRYIVECPKAKTRGKLKKYIANREGICPECGDYHEPIGRIVINVDPETSQK